MYINYPKRAVKLIPYNACTYTYKHSTTLKCFTEYMYVHIIYSTYVHMIYSTYHYQNIQYTHTYNIQYIPLAGGGGAWVTGGLLGSLGEVFGAGGYKI